MVMGCTIAPYICQRTTDMITYIHRKAGYHLLNYVDDFIGAEYRSRVFAAHESFKRLLNSIGAERAESKSVKPTQVIEFIGTLFDTKNMTIGITDKRKAEICAELETWRFKIYTTRRELETLVGKLQFIGNCVRSGRLFVSRLLQLMKGMDRVQTYEVSNEARKDIKWWALFLPQYSGTSVMWMLDCQKVDEELAVDACLQGAGGVSANQYYRLRFPKRILQRNYSIVHLEMWAVIIGIRAWHDQFKGLIITVKSDNEAVATIINTGRSHDLRLQTLLRELNWWLALKDIKIRSVHISGKRNRVPDLLSRWGEGAEVHRQFAELICGRDMVRKVINFDWFNLQHQW